MPVRSPMHSPPDPLPPGRGGARAAGEESTHRIVSVDRTWHIVSIHPEVLAMFAVTDRSAADLVGSVLWEAFPGWAGTDAERKLRAAMEQHAADDFQLHYPSSGTCIEVRVRPHWPALSIYLRDATAAQQPGSSPGRPRNRSDSPEIAEVDPVPGANLACAFDRQARLTHVTVALLDRWNVTLPDARGRTLLELNYPRIVAERLHRHVQKVLATGEPVTDEVAYTDCDGHTEAHEHTFSPLLGGDGAVQGVAGAIQILPGCPLAPKSMPAPKSNGDVQRAKVLGELAAGVFSSDPARSPLPVLFQRLAAAVGAECYLHHRADEGRSQLVLENSAGVERQQLGTLAELSFGEELPGLIAQQRRPVILHDLQDRHCAEGVALRDLGLKACAGHPLQVGERLLGTLLFATRRQPRFGEEELRFLQSAAALVAARLSGDATTGSPETLPEPDVRGEILKEQFLGAVVQELRVPLESTLLHIRALLQQPALPDAVRFELEGIIRNLSTESRLVNDLLDLTRLAQGELSIEHGPVNLHALLRDAVAAVKQDLADNGIVLAMSLPDVAPRVRGDAVRLQQVFWNLLKRAIRLSPRGGVVSLRLGLTPELMAVVTVTDSGLGLATESARRVFEPWAMPPPDDSTAGTALGFGMATVRKIVELHDGEIRISHPTADRGTSFTVELPLARDPPAVTSSAPAAARIREVTLHCRILLVEDQPDTREALLALLRQWRHEVIVATSVREARGLAEQHSFDLVICAVSLPDGSGYELMASLRLDHRLKGIALVGNGTEQDSALGRSAGFAACLSKPVSIEALEKALAAHLPAK